MPQGLPMRSRRWLVRRLGIEINEGHQANVATALTNSPETPVPQRFSSSCLVDMSGHERTPSDRIRGTRLAPESGTPSGRRLVLHGARAVRPVRTSRAWRGGRSPWRLGPSSIATSSMIAPGGPHRAPHSPCDHTTSLHGTSRSTCSGASGRVRRPHQHQTPTSRGPRGETAASAPTRKGSPRGAPTRPLLALEVRPGLFSLEEDLPCDVWRSPPSSGAWPASMGRPHPRLRQGKRRPRPRLRRTSPRNSVGPSVRRTTSEPRLRTTALPATTVSRQGSTRPPSATPGSASPTQRASWGRCVRPRTLPAPT